MRIELLFWSGCPSHPAALTDLRAAVAETGLDPSQIVVREMRSEGDAASEGFVGSPTIRIDGEDVQPAHGEPTGLTCRVYRLRDGRVSPTPDPADVREALEKAARAEREGSLT
jgi:hypothetical protein